MKAIGRSMAIAGAAIVAGFGMAIKTAAQFEQSMANTASVAGATAEELKNLSDYARKMGEQSVFSASQAADAMYFLASAGMNVTEIMGALEGTLALAAATASDLAYTSEAVAAALSQFGLEADEATRIANVYAAAISGSQATMEKLTTSMSYVGPMAKSMGMSIEDTVGILMNLYNAGLDGSKSGTALRMAFVKLIKPTEDGTAALEKLGISIVDSEGKMRPFKDIIDDLGKVGMSTADAMAIFGIRAGPAMMALVSQGTGSIQEMTDAITGTEKASEMAEMQIDTFQGVMKLLKSAFEELQITLVNDLMPALKGMIEKVTEGIKKISDWMKENPKLTETIVKWVAAIGVLMLGLGPLLIILPGLAIAISALGVVIGAIVSPIGLAVIAATALVFAFKKLYEILNPLHTSVEDVKGAEDKLAEVQEKLAEKLGITVEELKEFQKAGASISEMLGQELTPATNDFALILAEVERVAKETEESIKKLTETTDEFKAAQKELIDKIFELTHTAMEVAIKKLEEERQAYIDLGMSIEEVDEWYDLAIKKLEKFYKIEDKVIGKTKKLTKVNEDLADSIKEMGKETDKTGDTFKEIEKTAKKTFESVAVAVYEAGEALSDFTIKGVAAAITSIKMYYIPKIQLLGKQMAELFFPSKWYEYQIENLTKMMNEAISQVMYGYKEYQSILTSLGAGGGGASWPSYQQGTPYVPRTGLAVVHKGEAIIPASQNTYNQQKSYNTSSINIQPGAIVIQTPRFSGRDAKEMLAKIKREAAMQGYKFATA